MRQQPWMGTTNIIHNRRDQTETDSDNFLPIGTSARAHQRKDTKERSFGCKSVSSGSLTRSCILFLLSGFARLHSCCEEGVVVVAVDDVLCLSGRAKKRKNVGGDAVAVAAASTWKTSSTRERVGESRRLGQGQVSGGELKEKRLLVIEMRKN